MLGLRLPSPDLRNALIRPPGCIPLSFLAFMLHCNSRGPPLASLVCPLPTMCPRLALLATTAMLLLARSSLAATSTHPALPFGLAEPGCPPVSVDLLNTFTVGSGERGRA